jgi:hypothetical protein
MSSGTATLPKQELVISKAKVDACVLFFENAIKSGSVPHILVIHGPTCSGKTSLVRSVCASMKLTLVQVDELIDSDYSNDHYIDNNGHNHYNSSHDRDSTTATCMQNSKFPALALFNRNGQQLTNSDRNAKLKITFIDDIEALPEKSLTQLCKTLKKVEQGIYVLTCSDWYDVCRVSRGFRDLQNVTEIQLNQLATTFVQKAIKYWGYDCSMIPSSLIESGDLRACLYHAYMTQLASGESQLGDYRCDPNLTMFHALGRLFYPCKEKQSIWDPFIPEERNIFHLYIHHNMLSFMASIEEASSLLDALSLDDRDQSMVPLVEYTLLSIINRQGRVGNKVRPAFAKPEYFKLMKKPFTAATTINTNSVVYLM